MPFKQEPTALGKRRSFVSRKTGEVVMGNTVAGQNAARKLLKRTGKHLRPEGWLS